LAVDDTIGVGARAVRTRKLAGLTQRQLAERADSSLSLMRKVEQGTRLAPRRSSP
jgi:transcriptional regulator with XRE-family HTH domain